MKTINKRGGIVKQKRTTKKTKIINIDNCFINALCGDLIGYIGHMNLLNFKTFLNRIKNLRRLIHVNKRFSIIFTAPFFWVNIGRLRNDWTMISTRLVSLNSFKTFSLSPCIKKSVNKELIQFKSYLLACEMKSKSQAYVNKNKKILMNMPVIEKNFLDKFLERIIID